MGRVHASAAPVPGPAPAASAPTSPRGGGWGGGGGGAGWESAPSGHVPGSRPSAARWLRARVGAPDASNASSPGPYATILARRPGAHAFFTRAIAPPGHGFRRLPGVGSARRVGVGRRHQALEHIDCPFGLARHPHLHRDLPLSRLPCLVGRAVRAALALRLALARLVPLALLLPRAVRVLLCTGLSMAGALPRLRRLLLLRLRSRIASPASARSWADARGLGW
eukprot:2930971-Pleurochrysis_carterae.AAC.3